METDISPIKNKLEAFMKTVSVPVVASHEEYVAAGDLGKQVSNKIKELEQKRLEMTRPLDTSKKLIMDEFKKITDPLEAFLKQTKDAMLVFHRKEEARIAEKARILREKQAAEERERQAAIERERLAMEADGIPDLGEPEQSMVPPPVPAPIIPVAEQTRRGDVSTTTVKARWTYEVIDPALVPRNFCEPSNDHIRQAIAAGTRDIPGVKIWDAGTVSIR